MIYIYPKLPAKYSGVFFRVAGNGLANCLFVYARAISLAQKLNAQIITPTWFNISIGPYLRRQSDKRHYFGIFRSVGEVRGLKKLFILCFYRRRKEFEVDSNKRVVVEVSGLENFFVPILADNRVVYDYLLQHARSSIIESLEGFDFSRCVAVHVRLGDYTADRRVPLDWYLETINSILMSNPEVRFLLFSDGTNEELSVLLNVPNVSRVFFGNAFADILAISKCEFLIGSDSTFSAWGAYLGQVPCVFYRLKSSPVLIDGSKERIENK